MSDSVRLERIKNGQSRSWKGKNPSFASRGKTEGEGGEISRLFDEGSGVSILA